MIRGASHPSDSDQSMINIWSERTSPNKTLLVSSGFGLGVDVLVISNLSNWKIIEKLKRKLYRYDYIIKVGEGDCIHWKGTISNCIKNAILVYLNLYKCTHRLAWW